MVQPRSAQIKDPKTHHSLPPLNTIAGAYPVPGSTLSEIVNDISSNYYDRFLASTVTQLPGGAQENTPAIVIGVVAEPFIVSINSAINISISGVNGGAPIVVTFLASDFVLINGAQRLTASRAVARINSVFASLGVTYPVASNNNGFIQITSANGNAIVTGNSSFVTLTDNTPGIVTQLGFGPLPSISSTGVTSPQRGILTLTQDGKGGILPFRYFDGSTVLSQVDSLLSYGSRRYKRDLEPGIEVYGRVTHVPGPPINGIKFRIQSYAYGVDLFPSVITSSSDFSSINAGDQITIQTFDLTFGSNSIVVTFPSVTNAQGIINAVNQAWHAGTDGGGEGAGRAIVTTANPEPYHMATGLDDFYLDMNNSGPIHIIPTGNTATEVAASINSQIIAQGTAIVVTDGNNLRYVQIRSNSIDGNVSSIKVLAGDIGGTGSNTRTIEKLGISITNYRGSVIALPYGPCEILFRGLGGIGLIITGLPAVMIKLGLPATVNVNPTVKENLCPMPLDNKVVQYLFPEVMEFGEVPTGTDELEEKFLIPDPVRDALPSAGVRLQGQVPSFGSDGRIPTGLVNSLFDILAANEITLGARRVGTNPLQPRLSLPHGSASITLLSESNPSPSLGSGSFRCYAVNNQLTATFNAKWAGSNWSKDLSSSYSIALRIQNGAVQVLTFPATSAGPWIDSDWNEIPIEITDPSNGRMSIFGQKSIDTTIRALVPRLSIPYAGTIAARTLNLESYHDSGAGSSYRLYSDGIGGTIETFNAYWDGTLWHKDVADVEANATFRTVAFTKHFFRSGPENSPWDDTSPSAGTWTSNPFSWVEAVGALPARSYTKGTAFLGVDTSNIDTFYNVERIHTKAVDSAVRTLLWYSENTVTGGLRLYHVNNNGTAFGSGALEATVNAYWDDPAAQWTREIPGLIASYCAIHNPFKVLTKDVGPAFWSNFGWDASALQYSSGGQSAFGVLALLQGSIKVTSNPLISDLTEPNTLYGVNITKAFAQVDVLSGVATAISGFAVVSAQITSPLIVTITIRPTISESLPTIVFGLGPGTANLIPQAFNMIGNTFNVAFMDPPSGQYVNVQTTSIRFSFALLGTTL